MLLLKLSPPRSRWHKGHDCQHVYGVSISSTFYTSILQFDYSLIAMNDTGLITETSFESWSRSGVCDRFVYQNVVWLWLFEGWNNWSKDNKLIIPKVKVHTAFFLFSWHMALRWNYCKQSHWSWFYSLVEGLLERSILRRDLCIHFFFLMATGNNFGLPDRYQCIL